MDTNITDEELKKIFHDGVQTKEIFWRMVEASPDRNVIYPLLYMLCRHADSLIELRDRVARLEKP